MKSGFKILLLGLCLSLIPMAASADSIGKISERAQNAADVLNEIVNIPDKTVPLSLLKQATCIVVIPHVVRAGYILGGRFGKGLTSCRTSQGWSLPSFMSVTGGSWGLQIGVSATDLVLIFVRANAIDRLSGTGFSLGGNASVAAGPVGRNAEAGVDYRLDNDIYAYSRSSGFFGGLTVEGALLQVDSDANSQVYGGRPSARELLTGENRHAPTLVIPFLKSLETNVPTF